MVTQPSAVAPAGDMHIRVSWQDPKVSSVTDEMFRPPIHRTASAVLDRSIFSRTFPITAARVAERKNISRFRAHLEKAKDLIQLRQVPVVREDPDPTFGSKGGKCLLLRPEVKLDGAFDRSELGRQY